MTVNNNNTLCSSLYSMAQGFYNTVASIGKYVVYFASSACESIRKISSVFSKKVAAPVETTPVATPVVEKEVEPTKFQAFKASVTSVASSVAGKVPAGTGKVVAAATAAGIVGALAYYNREALGETFSSCVESVSTYLAGSPAPQMRLPYVHSPEFLFATQFPQHVNGTVFN